jgi:hypothetical protein
MIAMTATSSSSLVTGEIRPPRPSSDLSEHAHELPVSLWSFSPLLYLRFVPSHRCTGCPEVDSAMNKSFRDCPCCRPIFSNSECSSSTPRRPHCLVPVVLHLQRFSVRASRGQPRPQPCPQPSSTAASMLEFQFRQGQAHFGNNLILGALLCSQPIKLRSWLIPLPNLSRSRVQLLSRPKRAPFLIKSADSRAPPISLTVDQLSAARSRQRPVRDPGLPVSVRG